MDDDLRFFFTFLFVLYQITFFQGWSQHNVRDEGHSPTCK